MMAALSEPMTASGTISSRYFMTAPCFHLFAGKHWRPNLVRRSPQKFFRERAEPFDDGLGYRRSAGFDASRTHNRVASGT
jgi:hypothetical protein